MMQNYTFYEDGVISFDDSRTVRELIAAAFDRFAYEEPLGMEIVTLFQSWHPETNTGWFTTDLDRTCAEEIADRNWLFWAYHMPGCFYFAEGGWGHHMTGLGNHPVLPYPVQLKLKFEYFHHTVVFAGHLRLRQIVRKLEEADYIDPGCPVQIHVLAYPNPDLMISVGRTDPLFDATLKEIDEKFYRQGTITIVLESQDDIA